jgi:hypothetical protein
MKRSIKLILAIGMMIMTIKQKKTLLTSKTKQEEIDPRIHPMVRIKGNNKNQITNLLTPTFRKANLSIQITSYPHRKIKNDVVTVFLNNKLRIEIVRILIITKTKTLEEEEEEEADITGINKIITTTIIQAETMAVKGMTLRINSKLISKLTKVLTKTQIFKRKNITKSLTTIMVTIDKRTKAIIEMEIIVTISDIITTPIRTTKELFRKLNRLLSKNRNRLLKKSLLKSLFKFRDPLEDECNQLFLSS